MGVQKEKRTEYESGYFGEESDSSGDLRGCSSGSGSKVMESNIGKKRNKLRKTSYSEFKNRVIESLTTYDLTQDSSDDEDVVCTSQDTNKNNNDRTKDNNNDVSLSNEKQKTKGKKTIKFIILVL